jgi:hypothetical protein
MQHFWVPVWVQFSSFLTELDCEPILIISQVCSSACSALCALHRVLPNYIASTLVHDPAAARLRHRPLIRRHSSSLSQGALPMGALGQDCQSPSRYQALSRSSKYLGTPVYTQASFPLVYIPKCRCPVPRWSNDALSSFSNEGPRALKQSAFQLKALTPRGTLAANMAQHCWQRWLRFCHVADQDSQTVSAVETN